MKSENLKIMTPTHLFFRPAYESDRDFIGYMFELAYTWGDPAQLLPESHASDHVLYVEEWSADQGGIIVESRVETDAAPYALGAGWLRSFTKDHHGDGYVADKYPEVAISLVPEAIGHGLGPQLMTEVLQLAKQQGSAGVSLSVDFGNDRAKRSYEKVGFKEVGTDDKGIGYIMLYEF